jgi:hypothetical protein
MIGIEPVRLHRRILAAARARAKFIATGGGLSRDPPTLQRQMDGIRVRHPCGERLLNRGLHLDGRHGLRQAADVATLAPGVCIPRNPHEQDQNGNSCESLSRSSSGDWAS